MSKISSAKQQRRARPVEDEVPVSPMTYSDDVLHVYGQPLKAHADYPWLWSLNSLLEAVLVFQRGNGVSEKHLAAFKNTKKPGQWLQEQVRKGRPWDKQVRAAARTQRDELNVCKNTYIKPALLDGYALQTKLGRAGGVYLCASLVVAYCRYLHPEFGTLVDDFFARGLRGAESVIEEVKDNRAKNTATREDSKAQWPEFVDAMRRHGASVPLTLAEIYVVLFGKTRNDYMTENGIKEPFRDNVDEKILGMILSSQALTIQVAAFRDTQGQVKMNEAARDASHLAMLVGSIGISEVLRRAS